MKKSNFESAINRIQQDKVAKNTLNNLMPLTSHKETEAVFDSWINQTASVGANNSLTQYNNFILKRLDYTQCATISLDTLINKAIIALSYDIISHGYNIILEKQDRSESLELKEKLESRIKEYNLDFVLQNLTIAALRFGGALLYFDIDSMLETKINNDLECAINKPLNNFVVVEPDNASAGDVNVFNPLRKDYMKPTKWFISGAGFVDSSRLQTLAFYEVPSIIKPLFNYLGISLTQLMQDYTQNAEMVRQALSDLLLRFKTDYIKTSSENIASEEYLARIKYNNATRNNLSTILLSENEELNTLTTSISGIDSIITQSYELVVASSGIPATRLMGISPAGFNATGESDLIHYYELISQYQSKLKPILIECVRKIIAYDLKYFNEYYLDIEFNPIGYKSEKDILESKNLKADYFNKFVSTGIISEEEALKAIQDNDLDLKGIDIDLRDDSELESNLNNLDFGGVA